MDFDVHLHRKHERYWILFKGSETKNRREIFGPAPDALIRYFDQYFALYRPYLQARYVKPRHPIAAERPNAVWISSYGRAMSEGAIYERIRNATRNKFGRDMCPHLFRDSAATTIATFSPKDIRITTSVLGHTTLATSEKHYNHARSIQALASYHDIQDQILSRATGQDGRKTC
jgi:site-specific recombinase XerD